MLNEQNIQAWAAVGNAYQENSTKIFAQFLY